MLCCHLTDALTTLSGAKIANFFVMGTQLEIAKTRQISNPGFGFESKAKPGFRVWVSGL